MAFHVYVEGALDSTSDGVAQLAQAIGDKFGLPASDIAARLSAGRFRVKANVDRATADTFAKALQELGARVKVEDAAPAIAVGSSTTNAARASSPALPAANAARTSSPSLPAPSLPRTNTGSALPPPALPRTSTSPALASPALPRTTTGNTTKPAQMSSGLAAAFTQSEPSTSDLGALSSDSLSLASLDGNDTGSNPVVTFAEPANLPASMGPAAIPATPAPAKAKAPPVDLFAPPDAEELEARVDLAPEEVVHRERKAEANAAARAAAPETLTSPVLRKSQPQILGGTAAPSRELTRPMFAAGVLLAIALGFVPTHFVAKMRESSAYAKIDDAVIRTQQLATDEEAYAALDKFRSAQLSEKQSKHRSIALTSMLMWAVISAGLAFLYFKRPWEKLPKRGQAA
ncbi:MAG: hypothetical protein SFX73_30220 [Kofleriaceae bacterium]|nr:hypothetical protein [Kofleriaceae bacterium]